MAHDGSDDGSNDEVERLIARGRAAWPALALPDAAVRGHFADKLDGAASIALGAEDLFLACGCALGDAAALAAFDEHILQKVPLFLARMKPAPSLVDEVKQTLRVRLLVAADGEAPRIAEYSGRGSLEGWLRVAATRLAIDLLRREGRAPAPLGERDDDAVLGPMGRADPELAAIKERYRDELNRALADAFAALAPAERNLLRLSYRDGRSIDEIGALIGVHRATAARQIAAARAEILDETRRLLAERLALAGEELDSLIHLLRSQLHLSVSRLLPARTS